VIPDEGSALALLGKYGCAEPIVEHCRTVATVSMVLADGVKGRGREIDSRAVLAGALLHDIGRSRVQTFRHGIEGAQILQEEGVDEKVVEIVRRHVGAGISAAEAKSLGLPEFDYIPRTVEQRIVCFSDKMVDSTKVRPFEVEVQRFMRKGHDVPRLLSLRESIRADLGADPENLIFGKIKESS
jgi:uncharacterized protein